MTFYDFIKVAVKTIEFPGIKNYSVLDKAFTDGIRKALKYHHI